MAHTTQIEIEVFGPDYQAEMLDLIVTTQQQEFGIAITAEDQPDLGHIQSYYQKGKGNFWVAVRNEQVIGTIALLDIGNAQAALRKMFVKKAYRGVRYSVAAMLLERLFASARSNGIQEIFLGTTPQFLAAHRFYEKNGFFEIKRDTLPKNFPIMEVDTRFYKCELG